MREQRGYVFHKGNSWFVRFWQTNREGKRAQACEKLKVPYGGEYKTKRSVRPFVAEILAPVNSGLLNPQSTMPVTEFVERIYLPEYVEKTLRAATLKQYRDVWNNHLKPRMGKLTLRTFRTVHGEQIMAQIAAQTNLGRSSLRHCKAFLSGAFKQAKRLGILDGVNPVMDVSIPRVPESEEDTYAYSIGEINAMLTVLPEPAWTVVQTAALTGFRKSELRGITWGDFTVRDVWDEQARSLKQMYELAVTRSVWNSVVNEPKTKRSRAPIPVVKALADALKTHKQRAGILAQPDLPIFQAGNGKPLNLDNLVRRVIAPALSICATCGKREDEHEKTNGHAFERDKSIPTWHGWHAFRRGLGTNLHAIGVDDKTVQSILRHSNISLTMNVYVKTVSESQVNAMDALSKTFESCNDRATTRVN